MRLKLQPRLAVLTVSAVFSLTGVSAKLPMLVVLSMNPGRCALELDDFRSTSANAIVPEVAIFPKPLTLVSSVAAPMAVVSAAMVGVSLVPLTMNVTGLLELTPWLSRTVT